MRKKVPLYVLLVFLLGANVFFLYNYLGDQEEPTSHKAHQPPGGFLIEALNFDEDQKEAFREMAHEHRRHMRAYSDEIKVLKDMLFSGLSDTLLVINVDSITRRIGYLETKKDVEIYQHFKEVRALCKEDQKEKFAKIIEDALKRGPKRHGPPPHGRGSEGERPHRPNHPEGHRPPPPPPH